ncbi:MAG: hypothetical protein ACI8S6_003137 [Myxococcota bacterium]|jgi:hypothetical protein
MLSADDLSGLLSEHGGGVEAGLTSLWWKESDGALVAERSGHLIATLQLVQWDEGAEGRRINTIKEQQVVLVAAKHRDVSVERAGVALWVVSCVGMGDVERGPGRLREGNAL